jgi:hypothetical protein
MCLDGGGREREGGREGGREGQFPSSDQLLRFYSCHPASSFPACPLFFPPRCSSFVFLLLPISLPYLYLSFVLSGLTATLPS